MNGTTVIRTITINDANTVTYTDAQQITDFGSSQSTIDINIYHMSTLIGRGIELGVTL